MNETKTWMMLLPTVAVLAVFFVGAIVYSVLLSLNFFSITSSTAVGLQAYVDVLTDPRFISSFLFSLKVAFLATFISIVLAIVVSMTLRKTFVGRKLAMFVYQFNIPVPHLVLAISVLLLFAQTGLISRTAYALGLISSPSAFPLLVFDQTGIGIVLAFVLKSFPFIGVAILALLLTTLDDYEQQAATLGAKAWQRFRFVLLPMMLPSITFTSVLIFAYIFGSFEVPFLLGSTSPKALALLAYQEYTSVDLNDRPAAMAIANLITLAMVALVILAYTRLNASNRKGAADG